MACWNCGRPIYGRKFRATENSQERCLACGATVRLRNEVGALLEEARTAAGLSQARLASRVGMSKRQVRRLERGDIGHSFDLLELAADALGMRVEVTFRPLEPPTEASTTATEKPYLLANPSSQRAPKTRASCRDGA